jgi:hypothetical protein
MDTSGRVNVKLTCSPYSTVVCVLGLWFECVCLPRLMRCWQVIYYSVMVKATLAALASLPRSDVPLRSVKEDPCSPQAMCQCALCDSMCYMRLQANSVDLRMPLELSHYYIQLGNRLSVRPIIMV